MASAQLKEVIACYKSLAEKLKLTQSVDEARAGFANMTASLPIPGGLQYEPVSAPDVRGEWFFAPGLDSRRALLYLHGGGYSIGSVEVYRGLITRLSFAAGIRAFGLDYRLAPEHPFPAAVDDAVAAYRWLLSQGVEPSRLAVAGDSAGGGLTVATLLALRDLGEPRPAAAVCFSPWVDLAGTGESMVTRQNVDPIVARELLDGMAKMYVPDGDLRQPLASPFYADLKDLPPLLIQVGDAEVLLDDSVRLADLARAAGVDVTLRIWPEMVHDWHLFAAILPEGLHAIDEAARFISKHTVKF